MKIGNLLKKIIFYIGITIIFAVIFSNLFFTASISNNINEKISITTNSILKLIVSIIIAIFMYYLSISIQKIDNKKLKKRILILVLIAFYIIQIIWMIYRNSSPVADQRYVYGGASELYDTNMREISAPDYFGVYPQQLTLAFMFNLLFNIIRINSIIIVKLVNALANTLSLFAIYLITDYLGKNKGENKKSSNNPLAILLFCGFIAIPMLSTFIYGDEIGLSFALFSIYFIMRYSLENKRKYLIFSAILMCFGYMFRMNNLIIIIAILVYLLLDILKQKYNLKNDLKKGLLKIFNKVGFILLFLIIVFTPNSLVKNIMISKYNIDTGTKFPVIGYLAMGMSDSERGAGWYDDDMYKINDFGEEEKIEIYKQLILNRLKYFKENPREFLDFYSRKIVSTWAENSYSAIWHNQTFNFSDETLEKDMGKDEQVLNNEDIIKIIQKGVVLLIFISSAIFLIKNRKNLSNEVVLLLVIFIGGFLFHILWETKSRYIIPYIVVLIPIASMNTELIKLKLKNKKDDKNVVKKEKSNS